MSARKAAKGFSAEPLLEETGAAIDIELIR
jgi:hypothetical protein